MSESIVPTEYRQAEGSRQDRGLKLAATRRIRKSSNAWIVPSQSEDGTGLDWSRYSGLLRQIGPLPPILALNQPF